MYPSPPPSPRPPPPAPTERGVGAEEVTGGDNGAVAVVHGDGGEGVVARTAARHRPRAGYTTAGAVVRTSGGTGVRSRRRPSRLL